MAQGKKATAFFDHEKTVARMKAGNVRQFMICEATGISKSNICAYIAERKGTDPDRFKQICSVIGCDPAEVIREDCKSNI